MTEENLDHLFDLDFEYTCDYPVEVGVLNKRERPCGQPANHMFGYPHGPEGCDNDGISVATCPTHTKHHAAALWQSIFGLQVALRQGIPALCANCGQRLTKLEDAGTKMCLHD